MVKSVGIKESMKKLWDDLLASHEVCDQYSGIPIRPSLSPQIHAVIHPGVRLAYLWNTSLLTSDSVLEYDG